MPLRVANVIEEARIGGPQRRIAAVAARLAQRGIETVVVGPQANSRAFARLLAEAAIEYRAVPLQPPTKRGLLRYGLLLLPELRRLARVLAAGRFDLVHVSGGSWQIKGVLAARLAGLPALWHLNDTHRPPPIRWVFRLLSRWLTVSFIVAGRRVRRYYLPQRLAARREVFEIQAPVDTARFDPDRVEPDARLAGRSAPLVVLLASPNPDKGVHTLIEAAAAVVATGAAAEFWIVGETRETQARYRAALERSIAEGGLERRVRFFGPTAAPESVLAAADVVVCTSRAEASPMAVWEAMAMARPVVSTDVGDVRRFLEATGAGFVVPVGDGAALAERVVELLGNEERRTAMGRRGRQVVREHLSLERCAEAHASAYARVAGGGSRPLPAL